MSWRSWLMAIGHHRGVTSIPQLMQTLSPGSWAFDAALSCSPFGAAAGAPFIAVVEALRAVACTATLPTLAEFAMRLAFLTVPVNVISACLKFCT